MPVREAETIVRSRALAAGSPYQPQDGSVLAHITVLGPFMPEADIDDGVVADLERYFADVTAFDYTLEGVSAFPDGPAYLVPEPATVFRRLTLGLLRFFPEFPPYGGSFTEVVPHISVPLLDGEDANSLRREIAHRLPIEARAHSATLIRVAEGDTRTLATFPFGTTAA
ncbi:MAG: 2'-5' RNA ligase family protein [Actinomycetota bacterium]|nr:2'-5' RNA ligase family protein [Actinomycetota bacterium]